MYAAQHRIDGITYAIKEIPLRLRSKTLSATLMARLREIRILASLQHPHIVRYYHSWLDSGGGSVLKRMASGASSESSSSAGDSLASLSTDDALPPNAPRAGAEITDLVTTAAGAQDCVADEDIRATLYIQTELMDMNLRTWITSHYDATPLAHMIGTILHAVAYLHGQSPALVHGDIKPENILLSRLYRGGGKEGASQAWLVKLADFGLARTLDADWMPPRAHEGTATYQPPAGEVHRAIRHDSKNESTRHASDRGMPSADVYSLGVLIYELLNPFGTAMERARTLQALREGNIHNVYPPILRTMLHADPRERPDITAVLTFFTDAFMH